MFRIKTTAGMGLVALALAALGASAPVASAKPCGNAAECYGVLVSPGVHIPVPEHDPIDIVSEGVVTFTGGLRGGGSLVVNCPQGELNGSIIIVKGNLQGSFTGATFGGSGGAPCGSSMGPAVISAGPPSPWTLKTNGKAQIGPLALTLSLDEAGLRCNYSAKSIKGTYNTDEEPIQIGSKPPKFTGREGSSPGCPKKLTGSSNTWDVKAGAPSGGEFPLVFVG